MGIFSDETEANVEIDSLNQVLSIYLGCPIAVSLCVCTVVNDVRPKS